MDTSGRDLEQLCRVAKSNAECNPKIRQRLENDGLDATEDCCCINECGKAEHIATLNYFLTSFHTTEEFVEIFLIQTSYDREWFVEKQEKLVENGTQSLPATKNTMSIQLLEGVSALHLTVYRNSLHVEKIAKLLLNWGGSSKECISPSNDVYRYSLASISMTCGSCPLHILTGQNLTIKEELLTTLLNEDPGVAFKDDVNGDNPISLLWKNTLRFRWAISIMEGANFIDYIKNDDCSWMAVITPHQFIKFSLLMAAAALWEHDSTENSRNPGVDTIHHLCRIPRCPPMLLRLLQSPSYNALFGVSGNAFTFDQNGMLPIHHAVQSPPVTYRFVPAFLKSKHQQSIVEILLDKNPSGVKVADDQGRLPLHYALDSGCLSEKDLLALIRLYPDSLRRKDPKTGLLPFMLVAADQSRIATSTNKVLPSVIGENCDRELLSSLYIENFKRAENDQDHTSGRYQAEWKKDHVRMSFMLLMTYPDVIPFQTSLSLDTLVQKNGY